MAKRSRQARRSQPQNVVATPVVETAPAGMAVEDAGLTDVRRKTVDFTQVYAYVYKEMRNVIIVTALMFAVMIGLSFVL